MPIVYVDNANCKYQSIIPFAYHTINFANIKKMEIKTKDIKDADGQCTGTTEFYIFYGEKRKLFTISKELIGTIKLLKKMQSYGILIKY